jgi:hypothetical protein
MIETIFTIFLFPLLTILTIYIVKFINSKVNDINKTHDNDIAAKYTTMLGETVTNCVLATSQTYVETLKKQGKFDEEAQNKAFEMSYQAVIQVLSDDAKKYLSNIYGDLNAYIAQLIEAEVKLNK